MTTQSSAGAESTMPPAPFEDLLDGTGYKTRSTLGRGTMGEVVEAEHETFGRVVVKLLRTELGDRSDLIDRMRLEARVLERLNHPNIVRFLDFGETPEGRPFLVMEYLAGDTLRSVMSARGRFPVAEAISIARQTLAGLAAAHTVGILHRDIKPANLFVLAPDDGPTVLKILDFGVAKVLDNSVIKKEGAAPLYVATAPGTRIGTPRFLSPEQVAMQPLDARADLYAVGLVLYAMLVGKGPFDDLNNFSEILRAHLEVTPPPPSSLVPTLPRRLDGILAKALAKKRDNRFASANEFIAALDSVSITGDPGAASPRVTEIVDGIGDRETAPTLLDRAKGRESAPGSASDRGEAERRSVATRILHPRRATAYIVIAVALLIAAVALWVGNGDGANPPAPPPESRELR